MHQAAKTRSHRYFNRLHTNKRRLTLSAPSHFCGLNQIIKCWENYNATGCALQSNCSIHFILLKLRPDQCKLSPSNICQAFSFQTEKYHRRCSLGIYGLIKPLCVLCKCDYYRSLSVYKTMYYKCLGQPSVLFLQHDNANGKTQPYINGFTYL